MFDEKNEEAATSPDDVCQNALSDETELYMPITVGSDGFDRKINYLIKNYLPAESFGVIYGPSSHYKSFHAINWRGLRA